jgi:hypothetical protein
MGCWPQDWQRRIPRERCLKLASLGAKLIIQRAVEDEFDAWLGRARYARDPRAAPGKRNGFRGRSVQSAEGPVRIEIPRVREAAEPLVSGLFPAGKRFVRTKPLKAVVIACFVRGLSKPAGQAARVRTRAGPWRRLAGAGSGRLDRRRAAADAAADRPTGQPGLRGRERMPGGRCRRNPARRHRTP